MDWPVIGAVSAAVVVAGGVIFEIVVFTQSAPRPVKRTPELTSYGASVERSAYEIPGFATGRPAEWQPSFPLARLIDADPTSPTESPVATGRAPTPEAFKKPPATSTPATSVSPPSAKTSAPANSGLAPTTSEVKTASLSPPDAPVRVQQWRVVVTANASYFNLGGHVDKAGIVDSLASSHLRDALKSHKNFPQLPPDIKNHILTQNINLTKVAPYRGLLGMNDKTLEEEQAVRFERVASR